LLPLWLGVLPIQLDVNVSRVEIFCNIHLDSLVGRDHDFGCAVQLKKLSKNEARRARAKQEDFDPNRRVQLVEAVDGAGGGFEQGRLFVTEIVNLVDFLLWAANA